jgi:hypothetical protein
VAGGRGRDTIAIVEIANLTLPEEFHSVAIAAGGVLVVGLPPHLLVIGARRFARGTL